MVDSARQVENLLHLYAERIDGGDFEGLAALFAYGRIAAAGDDGVPTTIAEGRAAVLALYRSTTRLYDATGTPGSKHVTTNAILEVDDDAGTATCRSYFTVLQAVEGLPLQPIVAGRYHDAFRRRDEEDGGWWFDVRTIHVDLTGDLSHHLLF